MRELDEARSETDKIIDHIQKRLDNLPPPRAELNEFLLALREVRGNMEEALVTGRGERDQEQRAGDAGSIRKAIVAIWFQVTRLAGMWEAFAGAAATKRAGFYDYQDKEMRRRASTVGSQLGQRIRALRETLSFTQEELAKKAGIGVSYLSMIERGHRTPHLETLVQIAAALGITLSQLFIEAHEPTADHLPLFAYLGTLRLDRTDVDVLLRVAKAMFDSKP